MQKLRRILLKTFTLITVSIKSGFRKLCMSTDMHITEMQVAYAIDVNVTAMESLLETYVGASQLHVETAPLLPGDPPLFTSAQAASQVARVEQLLE